MWTEKMYLRKKEFTVTKWSIFIRQLKVLVFSLFADMYKHV